MLTDVQEKDFRKAGQIAGKTRDYGVSLIKEGALAVDILNKVEEFIQSQGAGIAFPAQISINTIAAHACSDQDDPTTIRADDVVKLDVGAHINGMIGDTARTVNLSGKYADLLKASRLALEEASKLFVPGTKTGEIGAVIQETISGMGFSPVRNLSGHGLGHFQIHTPPSIPNIALGESPTLLDGMTLACEPFATNGKGAIQDSGEPTVFSFIQPHPIRSPFAREVLKRIQSYNGLPFTTRWLSREFGVGKTRLALKELMRANIIHGHPPLKEVGDGLVSQHEHSFIVRDKPVITTKVDDD